MKEIKFKLDDQEEMLYKKLIAKSKYKYLADVKTLYVRILTEALAKG